MCRIVCCLCLVALIAGAARAEINPLQGLVREATSVTIALPDGRQARLEALVIRPDRAGRFPLVVIVHGTPRDPASIARMSPAGYLSTAIAFATRGALRVGTRSCHARRGKANSDGAMRAAERELRALCRRPDPSWALAAADLGDQHDLAVGL
jgi:dienelactone hydrolase